ncbi:hypothetical protein ABB02_00070 [Clostridiaceae bacterium JG1575]|nr:hypothetical protein ABB02_00070 [Clostridiaceae bacterium JG1575]
MKRHPQRLIVLFVVLFLFMLQGCAPLYRLIKGHDPLARATKPVASLNYPSFLKEEDLALADGLLATLAQPSTVRLAGQTGERESLETLRSLLERSGFQVNSKEFSVRYRLKEPLNLSDETGQISFESVRSDRSADHAPEGALSVVFLNQGTPGEIKGHPLKHKLVLIKANYFDLNQTLPLYESAGAAGVLLYSDKKPAPQVPQIKGKTSLPLLGISAKDAVAFQRQIETPKGLKLRLLKRPMLYEGFSGALLATPTMYRPKAPTAILCANLDVKKGPGATENASGVAVLSTLASVSPRLDQQKLNTVFALPGAVLQDGRGLRELYSQVREDARLQEALWISVFGVGDPKGLVLSARGVSKERLLALCRELEDHGITVTMSESEPKVLTAPPGRPYLSLEGVGALAHQPEQDVPRERLEEEVEAVSNALLRFLLQWTKEAKQLGNGSLKEDYNGL